MSNKRIDQLPLTSAFALSDLMEKERDPGGAKVHESCALQSLVNFILTQVNYNVFPNLASLKAFTSPVDERVYCILGFAAKGDGGAKIYYYDIASMAVPDYGSVVLPDNVDIANPGRYLQFTF